MLQILLVSRLLAPFAKVAVLIGIAVFADIQFNLGFTDMAIQAAEEYVKSELTGGWL